MCIESRDENQQRRGFGIELSCNLESAEPRHLDVEEDNVGLRIDDGRGCGQAILRLACDFDVRLLGEPAPKFVTCRSFIVDDKGTDHAASR